MKLCPHLRDEVDKVKPNMQVESIAFMKKHGFWNAEAEEYYLSHEESGWSARTATRHADGSPTRIMSRDESMVLAKMLTKLIVEKHDEHKGILSR